VVKSTDSAVDGGLFLSEACELYLRLKGVGKDKVFIRTANRNTQYVTKLLGDRTISSYSSNEAAQFRDWCIDRGMGIKTVKRVFSSIRAIVNLAIAEEGLDSSNAFAKTTFLMVTILNQDKQYPFKTSGRCNLCAERTTMR
jgi:hypothetical protein